MGTTIVQFAEWRMMPLQDEVDMYVKAVERNAKPGCKVFIKEHPRVSINKRVELIINALSKKGYTCIHISNEILRFAPVEIICRHIRFNLLISTASTSGLNVKYLYGSNVDLGVDEDDIKNFMRGDYLGIFIDGMRTALQKLDTWDGQSLLHRFDISPQHYLMSVNNESGGLSPAVVYEWIKSVCYEKGVRIGDILRARGINNVILYGVGEIGKMIAFILSADKNINLRLADTHLSGQQYMSFNIYAVDQLVQPADAVIITVTNEYRINEIKELLKLHAVNTRYVLTMHDLIYGSRL